MKPKQVVVVVSFLLPLLAVLSNLPIAFSDDAPERVLDVMQNPLETDRQYYILPAIRGPAGGGLKLIKTGNSDCPLTVLQDQSEVYHGKSVKFTITGDNSEIRTGTILDIEFVNKPECAKSGKWGVLYDPQIYNFCVVIDALNSKFQIEKYRAGYKLMFCYDGGCLDIGRFDAENGESGRRLTPNAPEPFEIVFVEAFEDNKVIKSVV
ncbi:hypothetical protein V8G54_012127 [Vigna mungo]|uniref:Uncharacterized protein n=1 Tax=Vigna mungo TaxID=3915 RepID=A0AAQ3NQS1_VIGMU